MTAATPATPPANPVEDATTKAAAYTSRDEIVPCDCVLLRGKAVVNEASLTGRFGNNSDDFLVLLLNFAHWQLLASCDSFFYYKPMLLIHLCW